MSNGTATMASALATWVIVLVLVVVGVLDVWIAQHDKGATVSARLWQLSRDYPIVPFATGMLVGHVFWPQK